MLSYKVFPQLPMINRQTVNDGQTDRKRSLIFKSVFHNIPSKFFLSLLSIESSILDHRSKIVERIHRVCFKG